MFGWSHLKFFVILKIVSWISQFIGHGVFERRAPAIFKNLLLSLVAPDFVMIELLAFVGHRKEDLKACEKDIVEEIK